MPTCHSQSNYGLLDYSKLHILSLGASLPEQKHLFCKMKKKLEDKKYLIQITVKELFFYLKYHISFSSGFKEVRRTENKQIICFWFFCITIPMPTL